MRLGAMAIAGVLVACGARTPLADGTSTGAPAVDASTDPPHCDPGSAPVVMEPGGHVTYATWNGSLFAMKDVGDVYGIRSYDVNGRRTGDRVSTRTNGALVDTADGFAATDIQDGGDWRLRRYDERLHEVGHTPTGDETLVAAGVVDEGAQFVAFGFDGATATLQTLGRSDGTVIATSTIEALPTGGGYAVLATREPHGAVAIYSLLAGRTGIRAYGVDDTGSLVWSRDLDLGMPYSYVVWVAAHGDGFFAWALPGPDALVTTVRAFDAVGAPTAPPVMLAGTNFSIAAHGDDVVSARSFYTGDHWELHVQTLAVDATPIGDVRVVASGDGIGFVRVLWAGSSFAVVYQLTTSATHTDVYLLRVCP